MQPSIKSIIFQISFLFSGCSETVPIYLHGEVQHGDMELIEDSIGHYLGIGVDFVHYKYGAVQLELKRQQLIQSNGKRIDGQSELNRPCKRKAWAVRLAPVIAHEIGHSLELEHVNNNNNVMRFKSYLTPENAVLSEKQKDRMTTSLFFFRACR